MAKSLRWRFVSSDLQRAAKKINSTPNEVFPVVGLPELWFSEICSCMTAIGEWSFRMGFEERPDVEVLHSILSIQKVQCSALAERNSEQAVLVEAPCFWMSAKKGLQIHQRNFSQSAQIRFGNTLHGPRWISHILTSIADTLNWSHAAGITR